MFVLRLFLSVTIIYGHIWVMNGPVIMLNDK